MWWSPITVYKPTFQVTAILFSVFDLQKGKTLGSNK